MIRSPLILTSKGHPSITNLSCRFYRRFLSYAWPPQRHLLLRAKVVMHCPAMFPFFSANWPFFSCFFHGPKNPRFPPTFHGKSHPACLRTVRPYFMVYDNNPHMGVSKNNGTPKSSILIGFCIINHPFWGTPIFGNTHITGSPISSPYLDLPIPFVCKMCAKNHQKNWAEILCIWKIQVYQTTKPGFLSLLIWDGPSWQPLDGMKVCFLASLLGCPSGTGCWM